MEDLMELLEELRRDLPDRELIQVEAQSIAEHQARRALELLGIAGPPVDIARITDLDGVAAAAIAGLKANDKAASGQSWFDASGTWQVRLNASDSRTRRRFTLAHELKHAIDDPYIDVLYHGAGANAEAAGRRAEEMCDYFAGCLLMPRTWLKRLWAGGFQDQRKLAASFGVSPAAMAVRLTLLGLIDNRGRHHQQALDGWGKQTIRDYLRDAPNQAGELTAA